ncbi:MAG: hypothetical protein CM15mP112_05350 [Flavobacteriales bacterium]|nr:MAG: hypothetical protein CM15mP112_05350 [Flavobacteriales bacterium]
MPNVAESAKLDVNVLPSTNYYTSVEIDAFNAASYSGSSNPKNAGNISIGIRNFKN